LALPSISSSARKGPDVPRLRLRPVRFGTVTLRSRLLVVTAAESKRLANGSSGRSETEMSCLSSSSFSPSVVPSGLVRRPYEARQSPVFVLTLLCLTLLSLTGPPSERMPLSTFLTMHGCSTAEMARDGIGSHGACCGSSLGAATCCSLSMVVSDGVGRREGLQVKFRRLASHRAHSVFTQSCVHVPATTYCRSEVSALRCPWVDCMCRSQLPPLCRDRTSCSQSARVIIVESGLEYAAISRVSIPSP
jgi:hypothetical protein